jgi:hypothetical protein
MLQNRTAPSLRWYGICTTVGKRESMSVKKRGLEVVRRNCEVVDVALAHLHEIPVSKKPSGTRARGDHV